MLDQDLDMTQPHVVKAGSSTVKRPPTSSGPLSLGSLLGEGPRRGCRQAQPPGESRRADRPGPGSSGSASLSIWVLEHEIVPHPLPSKEIERAWPARGVLLEPCHYQGFHRTIRALNVRCSLMMNGVSTFVLLRGSFMGQADLKMPPDTARCRPII